MSAPTILLLPGAFTTPTCYDWLAPHLEKAGYPVVRASLATTIPSSDPTQCSASQEGSNLLDNYLLPLIDSGKDVIIFAHSFGATSCSGAGQGLTQSARQSKGLSGGVIGFVGLSFAFPKDGHSQQEFLGGQWPDWCKVEKAGKGLLTFEPAGDLLYNDVEDEKLKQELVDGHLPQAISVFMTPVKEPLWTDAGFEGRRVYILPTQDNVFPAEAQKMFVGGSGVDWDVKEVDGGHCAFIAKAEKVASIVIDAAKSWA